MCENDEATLHFRGVIIPRITRPPRVFFDALFQFYENGNRVRATCYLANACIRNFKLVFFLQPANLRNITSSSLVN